MKKKFDFQLENNILKVIKERISCDEIIIPLMRELERNPIKLYKSQLINPPTIFSNIPEKRGLYYFEVKKISPKVTWDNLKENWDIKVTKNNKESYLFDSPRVSTRWDTHAYDNKHFFPFYVGKIETSLQTRIKVHTISQTQRNTWAQGTSALRLKQRYECHQTKFIMNCFLFRVSYIAMDITEELLPVLESTIRTKKSCMVGSDRA